MINSSHYKRDQANAMTTTMKMMTMTTKSVDKTTPEFDMLSSSDSDKTRSIDMHSQDEYDVDSSSTKADR